MGSETAANRSDSSASPLLNHPAEPSERKKEASPAACSFRAEPSKISFSLIEKIFQGRAQIKKCKEYFARRRALASGGGAGFIRRGFVGSRFGFHSGEAANL
jgi:hypothetical protein